MTFAEYLKIFHYLFKIHYPELVNIFNFPIEEIKAFYFTSDYFKKKTEEEAIDSFDNMVLNCEKIKDAPQIFFNYAYKSDEDNIVCSGSTIRIFNRTCYLQQLVQLKKYRNYLRALPTLYNGLNDFLISNPYCDYCLSYLLDIDWNNYYFKHFADLINDKNKIVVDSLLVYSFDVHEEVAAEQLHFKIELLNDPEEFINYARNNMSELEINCYSYNENNFNLDEIRQLYELKELYLLRRLWRLKYKDNLIGYCIGESYSSGLNLFNILDSCRIYIKNSDFCFQSFQKFLHLELSKFYKKFRKQRFNIIFKTSECSNFPASHLYSSNLINMNRLMSTRLGGAWYKRLINSNFRL